MVLVTGARDLKDCMVYEGGIADKRLGGKRGRAGVRFSCS